MQKLLSKYFKGYCTKKEYGRVLEFIKNKKNDIILDEFLLREWKEIKNEEIPLNPDENTLNSIHHKIGLIESDRNFRVIRNYKIALSIAAIVLVAFITAAFFYSNGYKSEITMHTCSTPPGGKMQIELPDGSKVWLNSGSSITYPSQFINTRTIQLTGEAYFDIEKKPERFIVESQYGNTEVYGTEFNVKAYVDGEFSVTLVEGSVKFITPSGKNVALKPGSQIFLENNIYKLKAIDPELETSWKDGRLIFRDEPLINMLTRLERWYNVDIELKDERLKDLKYTGTIEMETFSEVLELIKVTTPITYDFDRNSRILTISIDQ